MSEFYASVEWDILKVPAEYNNEYYDCCPEPYPDITFNVTMRRKTLFYTVNLIIPAVGVSFLTLLVFYLNWNLLKWHYAFIAFAFIISILIVLKQHKLLQKAYLILKYSFVLIMLHFDLLIAHTNHKEWAKHIE